MEISFKIHLFFVFKNIHVVSSEKYDKLINVYIIPFMNKNVRFKQVLLLYKKLLVKY